MTKDQKAEFPRLVFTVKETAAMLGNVSEKSVYRLLKRGKLKALSELRHKLITSDSILALTGLPIKEGR